MTLTLEKVTTAHVTVEMAALIKGMLARGDKQSDIAAFFAVNAGRVAEINTGQKHANVKAAPRHELPPPGPYLAPYHLWKVRVAFEHAADLATEAVNVIRKAGG